MELSAPVHLGAHAAFGIQMPENAASDISRVNPNEASGKSSTEARQTSKAAENASLAQEQKALREARKDDSHPAGPPPSFEISLLEVEQDLKKEIARMEAARAMDRDAQAISSEPTTLGTSKPTDVKPSQVQVAETPTQIETSMGMVYQTDADKI